MATFSVTSFCRWAMMTGRRMKRRRCSWPALVYCRNHRHRPSAFSSDYSHAHEHQHCNGTHHLHHLELLGLGHFRTWRGYHDVARSTASYTVGTLLCSSAVEAFPIVHGVRRHPSLWEIVIRVCSIIKVNAPKQKLARDLQLGRSSTLATIVCSWETRRKSPHCKA